MDVRADTLRILDQTLGLRGRAASFDDATPLLGEIPELDSMAVVSLITALEEHFGLAVDDDELTGATFATVGSLTAFVQSKLNG
jgi:acyl carrier protein